MANFHENNLVIAADEENMCKVLTRIAENLAANSEETGFSLDQIEGKTTTAKLYYVIASYIDAYYWCAFAGAPIDQEVLDAGSEEWGANEYHRSHLNTIAAALGNVATKLSDAGGPSVGVSFAPTGRPMSETACVHLSSCGNNYVLKIDYATAWEPNSKDIDSFFMGLPSGDYGVAFYDSDEIDEYESINAFCGLHHGRASLHSVEKKVVDEIINSAQLRTLADHAFYNPASHIVDIALLADNIAVREWSQLDWADDDINWYNPDYNSLIAIDKFIVETMVSFPWIVGVTGSAYEGREANVEMLVPGDRLKLVSDWETPYFSPVGIEVYTADGRRIGNLDGNYGEIMSLPDEIRTILACILPHIRAYAETVKPLSVKRKGSSHSTVTVRLEANNDMLSGIYDEVHNLLEKSLNERVLTSDMEGAR